MILVTSRSRAQSRFTDVGLENGRGVIGTGSRRGAGVRDGRAAHRAAACSGAPGAPADAAEGVRVSGSFADPADVGVEAAIAFGHDSSATRTGPGCGRGS